MIRLKRGCVSWLRVCRALILASWLLPLSLAAASSLPTTQDLANKARDGEELIRALEQEYVKKRQAILHDPSLSPSDRQRKISTMDGELKRNRVKLWATHIHPFQERIMEDANQGLSEADKIRPTGGSELYAKDQAGNFIIEKHPDGTTSKVYNRQFKGADLDVGTDSPEAAEKFYKVMKDNGFDPENSNRYSADFMNGKFTINVGPDDHPSGSYKHRASVLDMGNSYETFVSISCQKLQGKCPGKKLVEVNDVNSKGLKYLHDDPKKLLGFENQNKLGNAAKSALKALEVGEVTPEQLGEIAKGKGFAPKEFKKILEEIKEDGKSFAGVGLNKDNITDFQEMARGVTDQAVDNAKVSWEDDKRDLQRARQRLEEEFFRAKDNGVPEYQLGKIRNGMRDIDRALTDAQVRVNVTNKVNQRLMSDASAPPSRTEKTLRKVYDSARNAGGAVGTYVSQAGFDQATRTGATLSGAAKDAFRPGWLSAAGYGMDAYKLYNCSKDPASAARHVCYWKEGSGVVFNVMSDIGVAGSAGVGFGGALGTGTAAGLVTIGAPIIVTGVAGQKVSELVGEVKGSQAARLNEKFINYRAEERTLEVILRRETLARELLEKFKSSGNWEYLKQAQTHIARLRRAGKVSSDTRYSQSAELVQAKATEYASLVAAKPPKQDEYDFESNQLGSKNESDVANLRKTVADQKVAQGRNVSADTAADSLSFDDVASAVANHKAALAQIEKNRRETAEIYARIEESRKKREEGWNDFWQGLSAVAGAVTQVTAEYAEQKREIDEQLKKAEEIEQFNRAEEGFSDSSADLGETNKRATSRQSERISDDEIAASLEFLGKATGETPEEIEAQRIADLREEFEKTHDKLHAEKLLEMAPELLAPLIKREQDFMVKRAIDFADGVASRAGYARINSLNDMNPQCVNLLRQTMAYVGDVLLSITFEQVLDLLQRRERGYPYVPRLDTSTGEVSFKRLSNWDHAFQRDVSNLKGAQFDEAMRISYDENEDLVYCGCSAILLIAYGYVSGEVLNAFIERSEKVCPADY